MKIVLVETESSGNIGSVARIMKNFAHNELFLLNPKCLVNEDSKKMACNAQELLENAKIISELKEAGADYFIGTSALKGGEYNIPRNLSDINHVKINNQTALVLGSESQGLSTELLEQMDVLIRIPASENYPTLNISHALAIILYELFEKEESKEKLASIKEKELLQELFFERMNKEGMNEHEQETAKKAFKKLLGRAAITKREIQSLFGSFRRI